ncbi:30S ribosome-binding factor RbfA [Candidatus Tokpelaia sp.]|uniref:30S ribosome-binding factor RbfA n=1 Tax=Candidatus Tokpelaia sp. TaxID=2233777 RepID=UPI0012394F6A|nr:30S ribosome-binding factor RbfA [Candidatus Tokpelaia sp.]KAA6405353.1 30S ribosome-binding factor RbfA [Candidatus Tokpelaia sp.]
MKQHKEPSQRQLRMGEEIRHALALLLQRGDLRDPLLARAMISVAEVRMSPDLKLATCFIAPLDSANPHAPARADIIAALNRRAKYIRGQIAGALRGLRYMPEFRFLADTSFDNFAKIDALLRSPAVARDLQHEDDAEDA